MTKRIAAYVVLYYSLLVPRTLVSLRLDDSLRRRLALAARRRGRTPSELVRTAIEFWLEHEEGQTRAAPGEALAELVGCVSGRSRDRSMSSRFGYQSERSGRRLPARSASRRSARRKK